MNNIFGGSGVEGIFVRRGGDKGWQSSEKPTESCHQLTNVGTQSSQNTRMLTAPAGNFNSFTASVED